MKRTNTKSKSLAQITIENETYSIRATGHAVDRMIERKVDKWVVSGDVLALGKERLLSYTKLTKDVALIDGKRGITIILGFRKNTIYILTVIDKSDVYILDNTMIKRLGDVE